MAQGLNSTKSGSRPSHEAIEQNADVAKEGKTEAQKVNDSAMESAKRANNRTRANEDSTPGNSTFTK